MLKKVMIVMKVIIMKDETDDNDVESGGDNDDKDIDSDPDDRKNNDNEG